jgi:hypothetical protein
VHPDEKRRQQNFTKYLTQTRFDNFKRLIQNPKEAILNSEVKPIPFQAHRSKNMPTAFNQSNLSPFNSSKSPRFSNHNLNEFMRGRESDQKMTMASCDRSAYQMDPPSKKQKTEDGYLAIHQHITGAHSSNSTVLSHNMSPENIQHSCSFSKSLLNPKLMNKNRQISVMDKEKFSSPRDFKRESALTQEPKRISKEQIHDAKIRQEIPDGADIFVEDGEHFDFSTIKIEESIPQTRQFSVYKYKNPRTQRNVKLLKCDYQGCHMYFRKWHNFFDHLRVHTGERPFQCSEPGCNQSFTQKANLNKHMAVHQRRKRQKCQMCNKVFASAHIMKLHMRLHINEMTQIQHQQFGLGAAHLLVSQLQGGH